MTFPGPFLDELRAKLPVSEVVGRSVQLKKFGSEFKGLSPFQAEKSPSFTVNDQKGFYHDFSSGKNGDIFSFLMETRGLDFRDAVAECAQLAGIPLPGEAKPAPNGNGKTPHDDVPFDPDAYGAPALPLQRAKREITTTYDYADQAGNLLYQVCRVEWQEDGRHKKTFMQRRPDGDGHWIWGLSGGEFLRGRDGDWYQATNDRIEKWVNADRGHFPIGVKHGLYRLMELREEAGPDTTVFLPEGEKDVETLRAMGVVATTNSGGARNWSADHAEHLRGLDVVILMDNDDPGRERGQLLAASLQGIARRIRLADFSKVWPDAPKGADVTDWVRQREGTLEELQTIIDVPEWRPPPFVSQFLGIPFERLDEPGPEHEHVIDGLITVGDKSIIGGPSQSGKSFLAIHMAMCIATAMSFFGRKILRPGLVVYQAGEGGRGIKKRFRAWRQYFGLKPGQAVPLFILQSKVDIHSPEGDTTKLVDEIQGIARAYNQPVVAIVIDTLQKAQGAADENSGRDMGAVMANVDRIAAAVPGLHVCLVHHMNAGGTKLRGHTSVYAGVDQVVLVTKAEDSKVRTAVLDKQKDEEDGARIDFELHSVTIGYRPIDGKPITSCVVQEVGTPINVRNAKPALSLSDDQTNIFTALKEALAEHGVPPPAIYRLPKSVARVCKVSDWYNAYRSVSSGDDTATRQAMKRASDKFVKLRIIGRINPHVWITGRVVADLSEGFEGNLDAGESAVQHEFPEPDNVVPFKPTE